MEAEVIVSEACQIQVPAEAEEWEHPPFGPSAYIKLMLT